jgi:predicted AlkP superfamily phosphohydrolase/phosphomutase
MKGKVYVIGLDGGTFDLLKPWMDAGKLPNLNAMMHSGVSGELESVIPPVTGPAWTSFITGKNPGKHGVYEFKLIDRNTYQYHVIDPQSRRGRSIWDIVSQHGGRSVVLNLPITYPPEQINGVMVSGFMTPSGRRDYVHPPEMLDEIENKFGPYVLYPPLPVFALTGADADINQFLQGLIQQLDYHFQIAEYVADKIDPQFLLLHVHGGDLIGHWLWHLVDEANPHYDRALADKHSRNVFEYFRRFDERVGRLVERAGQDTNVFIISDHGNGSIHTAIDLNNWLLEQGYLTLKETAGTKLKYRMWKMGFSIEALLNKKWLLARLGNIAKKMLQETNSSPLDPMRKGAGRVARLRLTYHDVDWTRTKAFCYANIFGQMIINVKGLWSQGCVAPGEEYRAVRDEIARKLADMRDPSTGQPVKGQVFLKDDVYKGAYMDDAPDITFVPLQQGYLAGGYRFISNKVCFPVPLMTGFHRMNGIMMGLGPALRSSASMHGAQIIDMCPTMLYLMGLPVPKDVDGEVLSEIVAESFLKGNAVMFADSADADAAVTKHLTPEEEADIISRLQGLGYL